MCPSLDRGVCNMLSLSCAKAYTQSLLIVINSASLHAASPREWWWAWCGCVHTATRPNTLSPLTVLSCTIRRNATSHLGFFMSPYPPAWERACSSLIVVSLTWNCKGGRDHVTPILPELTAPIGQHLWRSACSCSFSLLQLNNFSQ